MKGKHTPESSSLRGFRKREWVLLPKYAWMPARFAVVYDTKKITFIRTIKKFTKSVPSELSKAAVGHGL